MKRIAFLVFFAMASLSFTGCVSDGEESGVDVNLTFPSNSLEYLSGTSGRVVALTGEMYGPGDSIAIAFAAWAPDSFTVLNAYVGTFTSYSSCKPKSVSGEIWATSAEDVKVPVQVKSSGWVWGEESRNGWLRVELTNEMFGDSLFDPADFSFRGSVVLSCKEPVVRPPL